MHVDWCVALALVWLSEEQCHAVNGDCKIFFMWSGLGAVNGELSSRFVGNLVRVWLELKSVVWQALACSILPANTREVAGDLK